MANRGDGNRQETPRTVKRMLAATEFSDAHHRGIVKRLFQQAAAHAQEVDRYILPGHGYRDPAEIEAEMEVEANAQEAAKDARLTKSKETTEEQSSRD